MKKWKIDDARKKKKKMQKKEWKRWQRQREEKNEKGCRIIVGKCKRKKEENT